MKSLWPLLRDGLRLRLLLRPRQIGQAHVGHLLILLALLALPNLVIALKTCTPPVIFNPAGIISLLARLSLSLLGAYAIVRLAQRPALWLDVAAWIMASAFWIDLLLALLVQLGWLDLVNSDRTLYVLLIILMPWDIAILNRIAMLLAPSVGRALAGSLLALLLGWSPLLLPAEELIQTDWENWMPEGFEDWEDFDSEPTNALSAPEATLYAQPALLQNALQQLAPQRPDRADLYLVGFAGDADEVAFRNEVDFLPALAAQRLDAEGRVLRLINRPETAADFPLASVTNLERALSGIGQRMDPEQDILFLYLSSHGGPEPDHHLYINQPPLPLDQLEPARLRRMLDASGIRHRVIVISACFSGGYLSALDDPDTLVITAARSDRTSFGCGNTANATWFGQSFLIEGLNQHADFQQAFKDARQHVSTREQAQGYDPSHPQLQAGQNILATLRAWSAALPAGEPAAFVPSIDIESESESAGKD